MPRYLPVQLDAATEKVKEAYAEVEQKIGTTPNFIKTLAHSQKFVAAVAHLYSTVLGQTSLSEKLRQLAILKTCKLDKCRHTVMYHSELARKAGWSDQHLEAMDDYYTSDLFTYYERDVLQLAELVTQRPDEITNEYWTQLDNHFTSDQVVELITLVAFFNMVNRFILALEIEADPIPAQQEP